MSGCLEPVCTHPGFSDASDGNPVAERDINLAGDGVSPQLSRGPVGSRARGCPPDLLRSAPAVGGEEEPLARPAPNLPCGVRTAGSKRRHRTPSAVREMRTAATRHRRTPVGMSRSRRSVRGWRDCRVVRTLWKTVCQLKNQNQKQGVQPPNSPAKCTPERFSWRNDHSRSHGNLRAVFTAAVFVIVQAGISPTGFSWWVGEQTALST